MDVSNGRWQLAGLAVVLAAGLLYTLRLGDRAVTSEEPRWAEIAREMRDTGDYLHPTINGQTYYDKPVGSYWLIVAASHLTGGVNETAARLPAAISGVAAVVLLMWLGRKLYDERTAVTAGAVLATSFAFVFYARRATADEETVAGVLAAVCLYVRSRGRGGAWVVLLWAVMAATSLTKGLLGFALPVVVMAADGCRRAIATRREVGWGAAVVNQNRWLFTPWTLLAVPLGITLYFLPFLLSVQHTGATAGLDMVWRENVKRFVAPHNHTGPVYLYVGVIFVLAAPWSVFLPAALIPPPKERRNDGHNFATTFFWAVFLFFTASASRRPYYLLPVLPAASLLIARLVTTPREHLGSLARRLRDVGWFLLAVGVVAAGAVLIPLRWVLPAPYDQLPVPGRWAFAVGWVVALVAAGWTVLRKLQRPERTAIPLAFALFLYVFGLALPEADGVRTRREIVAKVRKRTDADPERLALFHARDAVFDLGRTVKDFTTADELKAALADGRVRWVLARSRYLNGVDLPAAVVAAEAVLPWEGVEQVGDKLVLLEATMR